MRRAVVPVLSLCLVLLTAGCQVATLACTARQTTVARGLTNPRGLAIGPDGTIYVAEAGTEATGGRVSRIDRGGSVVMLLSGLPHSVNTGVEDVGASGVAVRGGDLYIVVGEGSGDLASSLLRLRPGERVPEMVASLAAFETRYNPDDAEVESNPFGLAYDGDDDVFLVTDGAGNSLLRVTPAGDVSLLAVWRDGVVPTGVARAPDGSVFVALFGRFPHQPGNGRVDRLRPDRVVETVIPGATMPIGVAFGRNGEAYVLEFASRFQTSPRLEFVPRSGRLLRVTGRQTEVLVDRLSYPTALLADPEGGLLISTMGAMGSVGSGAVVRVEPCPPRIG